jgi:hypothetical protein
MSLPMNRLYQEISSHLLLQAGCACGILTDRRVQSRLILQRKEVNNLPALSSARHLCRPLALLLGLFFLWMNVAVAFQHQGCFHAEVETALTTLQPSAKAQARFPQQTRLTSASRHTGSDHCLACYWQKTSASEPILPIAFSVDSPAAPPLAYRPIAYLPLTSLPSDSRAPPVA